jgi:hypothetical protein
VSIREIRDRVIADGLAEVESTYEPLDPRREGATMGFELCRSLDTREGYERVLRARAAREKRMREGATDLRKQRAYKAHRWASLQIEWVFACCLAAGWASGEPLNGRAAYKVAMVTQELQREQAA